MHIIRGAAAPTFQLPGVQFVGYAAPSRGSADVCAWRIQVEAGLRSDQAHMLDQDEIFLVIGGRIQLAPDGVELAAGDCAIVPAGEPIQLCNPGDSDASAHVVIRAGFKAAMADGTVIDAPPWAQ
jgi:mannose-6-phosphate isomerase-like protein (cupin superfamily)